MPRPWMPFYVGDYLGDTEHLSTLQHGAYCLLLFTYWKRGGLPNDERQLASIAKLSLKAWRRQRPILQAFFHDGWKHKRVDAELTRHERIRVLRVAAGARGGVVSSINRFRRR
jgi:uncharacterized protein YdaU (DUF1376 family)